MTIDQQEQQIDAEDPWPGLAAFTEPAKDFFHGRIVEIGELARRIRRDILTLFYGQSGLGKTSVLRAGLFPALRDSDYLPIYIRLDFNIDVTFLDQVKLALNANLVEYEITGPQIDFDQSLWAYFHDKTTRKSWNSRHRLVTPIIAFDQFEEFFTLGRHHPSVDAFVTELADLVENRPSAAVRRQNETDPESAGRYDYTKEDFRVVISLREDYLADLDSLRRTMPSLFANRMRLMRMNGEQALQVIEQSGRHLVARDVPRRIIAFVAKAPPEQPPAELDLASLAVEPALLSIVCRELNNKRMRFKQPVITGDLLAGAQDEIVVDFYNNSVADLRPTVRLFVEEELLTAAGFRSSRSLDDAVNVHGVTRDAIDTLIGRRLLRLDERLGTQWVELTHDLLTGVIRQQRDLRREQTKAAAEAEARAEAGRVRAERAEAEAQRERVEQERQRLLAERAAESAQAMRRQVRRTRIALAATAVTLVIAIGAAGLALYQRRLAEERTEEIAKAQLITSRATLESIDFRRMFPIAINDLQNYKKSMTALVNQFPWDRTRQRTLSVIDFSIGILSLFSLDTNGALEALQEYNSVVSRLAANQPDNADLQHDLAASEGSLGMALEQMNNDSVGAEGAYRQALDVLSRLDQKSPGVPALRHEIAVVHARLGGVVTHSSTIPPPQPLSGSASEPPPSPAPEPSAQPEPDTARAVKEYAEFQAIVLPLVRADPKQNDWLAETSSIQQKLSDALVKQKHPVIAVYQWAQYQAFLKDIIAANPNNKTAKELLLSSDQSVAQALRENGNLAGAAGSLRSALNFCDTTPATCENIKFDIHLDLLSTLLRLKRTAEVADEWKKIAAMAGNDASMNGRISQKIDDFISEAARATTASATLLAYDCALAIMDLQQADGSGSARRLKALLGRADAVAMAGNLDSAIDDDQKALVVARQSYDAQTAIQKQSLANVLRPLSRLLLLNKQAEAALAPAEEAMVLAPNDFQNQENVADLYVVLGRLDAAKAIYGRYKGKFVGQQHYRDYVVESLKEIQSHGIDVPGAADIEQFLAN